MFQSVTAANLCRACATNVGETRQLEASKQFHRFRHLYSTLTELKVKRPQRVTIGCNYHYVVLKVYDDDDLPNLLCPTCVGLLETIESFKEACARSIDSIRKLIIANLKEEPLVEIVSAEALQPILKVEHEQDVNDSPTGKVTITRNSSIAERPMCDLCGKTFVNLKGIREHMRLKLKNHVEQKVSTNIQNREYIGGKFYCTQTKCRRSFNKRKNLVKHLKMHADSKVSCLLEFTEYFL
jgi:hypothetical protein